MIKRLCNIIGLCIIISTMLCACGKKGNPIILPDREDIISIGVSDGENYAMSPNTEKEADAFIGEFLSVLMDMEVTNKESITDAPVNVEYIEISLNCDDKNTTLFYYKDKGNEYVEQPYQGIYKPAPALGLYITEMFNSTDNNPASLAFQATVIETNNDTILVKPVYGSLELDSADQFSIPNKEELELQAGDLIEISYNGEIMESYPAQLGEVYEITVIERAEADAMWDRMPMVRVNGKLYYDTGKESTINEHSESMDGQITSEVDGSKIPTANNQSNFGTGFGYQYGEDDTIEVYMNDKWFIFEYREEKEHQSVEPTEPFVVKTYEVTESNTAFEDDELVTMVKYYEMSDGTWKTDNYAYQYKLEITGRMGGAEKDSTFVFLSNIKDITFEQAWKAAGFSSNMDDYFKEEDAKFVALK